MADKYPMQANGKGTKTTLPDENGELASRRGGLSQTGESGGGAYPNPHRGKGGNDKGQGNFMGHGGQTEMAYHGKGQLGDKVVDDPDNASSTEP